MQDDGMVAVLPAEIAGVRREAWRAKLQTADGHIPLARSALERLRQQAMQEALPPVTPEQVASALAALSSTNAVGLGLWHPRQLLQGPWQAMCEIAQLLNCVEDTCCWPSQAMLNKIVFLTKPNGDDRNIGLAATIFRAWQVIRQPLVSCWHGRPWQASMGTRPPLPLPTPRSRT